MKRILVVLAASLVLVVGCSKQDESQTAQQGQAQPQAKPPVKNLFAQPGGGIPGTGKGKVISAQAAGGYIYTEVESNGNRFWIAGNRVDIKAGDEVAWSGGAVMTNFTSKSLGRTFDQILFVSAVQAAGGAATATQGKVLTVASGGGYSYVEVEAGGGKKWLAGPETHVKVGDDIQWQGGAVMYNFTSKALDRKFEQILFVSGIYPAQ